MPNVDRIEVSYPSGVGSVEVGHEGHEFTVEVVNAAPVVLNVEVAQGIGDAPSNGSQYARKDGTWEIVATPTHSHELDDLDATGITDGYVLTADGAGNAVWAEAQAGGGSGTVTSVSVTVPTGLSVSGSPITSSGTLAISLTAGYAIPTTAALSNAATAFGWGDHAAAGYLTSATAASTYQTLDADLTAIAGLSSADGNFIVGSAGGWVAESGSTARSSLGLGSLATLFSVDPATVDLAANYTWEGSHTFPNLTGLSIWDYVGDHRLYFGTTEDLTASRTLYFDVSDANRIVTIGGDATIAGTNTGDQDLSGYLTSSTASSTYQPLDTQLTSLAALAYTGNALKVVRVNAGETDFELAPPAGGGDLLAANNLSDLANAGTARTNLGLGTLATQSGTFSGTSSGTNTGDQNLSTYVVGPGSATAFGLPVYDGTTGKLLKTSSLTLDPTSQNYLQDDNGTYTYLAIRKGSAGGTLVLANTFVIIRSPDNTDYWGAYDGDLRGATNNVIRLSVTDSGLQLGNANARVATILDEDAMGSNSATALATQQSIKAYADLKLAKSALGTGVETFLATPSSANLATAVTGETGSGALVFATSPALVTPDLGTPSAAVLTNATGTAASLTAGTATAANGLKSATTTVVVSSATAPSSGQVLTATSSTAATWQTPASGGITFLRLTADFATTSTSFVDVDNGGGDDLIFSIAANTNYLVKFIARVTSTATTDGLELGINGPASPNSVIGEIIANQNTVGLIYRSIVEAYDADVNHVTGSAAASFLGISAWFIIRNGANSGNLAIRFRSEVGSTTTIKAGAVATIETITAG